MEHIHRLQKFPIELLKAYNVSSIIIDGIRIDKDIAIEKAKREAKLLLDNREYLSAGGIEELENILKL
tara:strand:- start:79 stop:282 length:204 start_codon:yes stop_codon:yes gene_type:complete